MGHHKVYCLSRAQGDLVVFDEAVELGRRHDAACNVVHVYIYNIALVGLEAEGLTAVGDKEVFGRDAPVKECPVDVFIYNLKVRDLSGGGVRLFGRGYKPVLGVVVYKYIHRIAHLVGKRNVTVGQQYFVAFFFDEIKPVVLDPVNGERLVNSCVEHRKS